MLIVMLISLNLISNIVWSSRYVVVESALAYMEAKAFCEANYVSFASIHSQSEFDEAKSLCASSNGGAGRDCWIGLDRKSDRVHYGPWRDLTVFDFGNTFGSDIWYDHEGWPEYYAYQWCVYMKKTQQYRWRVWDCYVSKYFLCNTQPITRPTVDRPTTSPTTMEPTYQPVTLPPPGVKYIAITTVAKSDWYESNTYCSQIFGTSLASIHSQSDFDEAVAICDAAGSDDCWIGLKYDTALKDGTFGPWTDGTSFDFGNSFSVDIWYDNTPDTQLYANQYCVHMENYHEYRYRVWDCYANNFFLCNLPTSDSSAAGKGNNIYLETTNSTKSSFNVIQIMLICLVVLIVAILCGGGIYYEYRTKYKPTYSTSKLKYVEM